MNSWQNFKEQYAKGSVVDLIVSRKAPPGLIFFDFTESIQGSLHVSELNWNFGLSQADFREINLGDTIRVYVIAFDDRHRKVFLGRRLLIEKPSESDEWRNLDLRKETTAIVFEEFQNKVIIQLKGGLFGSIPLIHGKEYKTGTTIKIIPIRKLSEQNVIDCTLKEIAVSPEEQSVEVVRHFKDTVSENNFLTSENCLHSIKHLSDSLYWNYFGEEEREAITNLFESTENLFSKVEKGEEPIYFEFDFNFNNRAYSDFTTVIAPTLFISVPQTERDYLTELSKQSFWYTQYEKQREVEGTEQKIIEKYFSLYNEALSIWGKIEDGNLKILAIKAKVKTESLREKQQTLKRHDNFLISRPTIFYYKLQTVPSATYNETFIQSVDNKIEAFKLFQFAKEKSIDILLRNGKDFKIFSNYLESQIDFENKAANETEIELSRCWLNTHEIQNETTNFFGELIADSTVQKDEQVVISLKGNEDKPLKLERGIVVSVTNRIVNIVCPSIHLEQIETGCYIKKVVSTKQYKVQLSVLEKFFENTLPLENFYNIFHNREGILPPKNELVQFKNTRLADSTNPQSAAVKKAVGNQNILLIQGPPGTGKTTVITEIVKQLIDRGEKVLVASPTHVAVDNVLNGIKDDSRINIARIGHQEAVADFAQPFLVEEARKTFSEKIQNIVEVKIDLIQQHINGKDISNYSKKSFQLPYTFDWNNIDDFVQMIQKLSLNDCPLYIEHLEKWKEVIAKSPIILTEVFLRDLDVVFGTCIGIATNKLFAESEIVFDTVILDEAGKANISETLTAVSRAKKIILVGDHKQLPPFLDKERVEHYKSQMDDYDEKPNENEIRKALGASFFEYLQNEGMLPKENKEKLKVQHRMHPNIANFVSQTFYDSDLENGEETFNNTISLPQPLDKEILFIDTSSDRRAIETKSEIDGSIYNNVEAEFIANTIIPLLQANNLSNKQFAIVCPYQKQCDKINELLSRIEGFNSVDLEVATLDSFQGKEYDVIVFSFTRSPYLNPADRETKVGVGFLDDARRLNVAFSRAKKKLILIGNARTLTDRRAHFYSYYIRLFNRLIEYARTFGSVLLINEIKKERLFSKEDIKKTAFNKFTTSHKIGDIINQVIITNILEYSEWKKMAFIKLPLGATGIAYYNPRHLTFFVDQKVNFKVKEFRHEKFSIIGEIKT